MLITALDKSIKYILQFYVVIIIFIVFVPINPYQPNEDLDPSWILGLNESYSIGKFVGSDILFTFGPLSSLSTKQFHQETYNFILILSIVFSVVYSIIILKLLKGYRVKMLLFILLSPTLLRVSMDAFFLTFPIISFLYLYKNEFNSNILIVFLISFGVSLISLIKGTYLFIGIFYTIVVVLFYVTKTDYIKAFVFCFGVIGSTILVLLSTGHPLTSYLSYVSSLSMITSGYSEAMASYERTYALLPFIVYSAVYLLTIRNFENRSVYIVIMILAVATLLLLFKAGFTRQMDLFRVAFTGLLVLLLVTPIQWKTYIKATYISSYLVLYLVLINTHFGISVERVGFYFIEYFRTSVHFVENTMSGGELYRNWYQKGIDRIQNKYQLPTTQGTTDLYNHNLSVIIASDNTWSPRPVFQSYAAYTPELATINRNHLIENSPDNIFFKVETIDNRLPTLDDGSSWPILLSSYIPDSIYSDYLHLKKSDTVYLPNHSTFHKSTNKLDEMVYLPPSTRPIFAIINIQKTILGSLKTLAYKPEPLFMTVYYEDFSNKTYRFIAAMGESPFLISPMVTDTDEFLNLFSNSFNRRVRAIKLFNNGLGTDWEPYYQLELQTYELSN